MKFDNRFKNIKILKIKKNLFWAHGMKIVSFDNKMFFLVGFCCYNVIICDIPEQILVQKLLVGQNSINAKKTIKFSSISL